MPEYPFVLESLPDFTVVRVGISIPNQDFSQLISPHDYVFGQLFKHIENIGYFAFTPSRFILGSNISIESISKKDDKLFIRECGRNYVEHGLEKAPKNLLGKLFFGLRTHYTQHPGIFSIDSITPEMVRLLQITE